MCDREFKELVKIAVEKLKDESVLKLLQAGAGYQKDSHNEGSAEDAFHIMAVLFPEKWDTERIREALSRKSR